jgi:hypothetical protein
MAAASESGGRVYRSWEITEREALAASHAILLSRVEQVKVPPHPHFLSCGVLSPRLSPSLFIAQLAQPTADGHELTTPLPFLATQALQAEWDGQKDAQPSKVVKKKKKKTLDEKMVPSHHPHSLTLSFSLNPQFHPCALAPTVLVGWSAHPRPHLDAAARVLVLRVRVQADSLTPTHPASAPFKSRPSVFVCTTK